MTTTRTALRTTFRSTLVLAALASVTAATLHPAHASVAPSTSYAAPTATRLAGADRFETAVAISRHQFPNGAKAVYLVNGSAYADAVSAGMAGDGPILLVPGSGPVPPSVLAEVRRLAPAAVYAVGGSAVVPASTLAAAAQGRTMVRLAGSDRYATAAIVAKHSYRAPSTTSGDHATFFVNSTPTVDAVVAGAAAGPSTPILPVPATGPAPAVVKDAAAHVDGGFALAIGGPTVVSDATLASAAKGQVKGRIAGRDRYDTAVRVAGYRFASGSRTVYLARGDVFADALAAGSLTAGPVLLVPKDGTIPQTVATYLQRTHPVDVVALGGTGAVSDRMLTAAKNAAFGRMPTADVVLHNPYTARDVRRPGWTVVHSGTPNDAISCDGPSPAATVAGTYQCGASVHQADACYVKPGYPGQVTCILDPFRKTLVEYYVRGALPRTAAVEPSSLLPLGVLLTTGETCRLRDGGAWPSRPGDQLDAWSGCPDETALWAPSDGDPSSVGRLSGSTWTYRHAPFDPTKPVVWKDATARYLLG